MTALSAEYARPRKVNTQNFNDFVGSTEAGRPMKGATTIFAGALVAVNTSGFVLNASDDVTLVVLGVANETVVNAGADGAARIRLRRGEYLFDNSVGGDEITDADVGDYCYVVDNNKVAKGATARPSAGVIRSVDSGSVWIDIGYPGVASGGDVTIAEGGTGVSSLGQKAFVVTDAAGAVTPLVPGANKSIMTDASGLAIAVDSTVLQLQDLIAMSTAALPEGYSVFVQEFGQPFRFRTSTLAVTTQTVRKPVEVVAPADNAAKRWIREPISSLWNWAFTWFVDQTIYGSGAAGVMAVLIAGVSATFSGGTGFTADSVGRYINIATAASPFNVGSFKILTYVNATTVTIECKYAVAAAALAWTETLGYDGADGQIATTPLFTCGEQGLRKVVAAGGINGVLPTGLTADRVLTRSDIAASDTYLPNFRIQASGVNLATSQLFPTLFGYRKPFVIGSGRLGTISAVTPGVDATLTGGTGFTAASVGRYLRVNNAATPANNGLFRISVFISATSVKYENTVAVFPDANSGSLLWSESVGTGLMTANATLANPAFRTKSTFQGGTEDAFETEVAATKSIGQMIMVADLATGSASTGNAGAVSISAASAVSGFATVTVSAFGTGGPFSASSVHRLLTLAGSASGNNGTYIVTRFISANSVEVSHTTLVNEAAGTLSSVEKNPKVAWIASAQGATGAPVSGAFSAGISAVSAGIATLSGVATPWTSPLTNPAVGMRLRLSGSANEANNAECTVTEVVSTSSIKVTNFVKRNTAGNITAIGDGVGLNEATYTDLSGTPAVFPTDAVTAQRYITITGAALAANNGTFLITARLSATSVRYLNAAAATTATGVVLAEYQSLPVADAANIAFQGLVEVAHTWFDQTANPFLFLVNSIALAAPLSGSPYVVVKLSTFSPVVTGSGNPAGVLLRVSNIESGSGRGPNNGASVLFLDCKSTATNTFIPNTLAPTIQTRSQFQNSCHLAPAPFTQLLLQEEAYVGGRFNVYIGYRLQPRESGVNLGGLDTTIQGGFIAHAGNEAGGRVEPRPLDLTRWAIYNNVQGSVVQPGPLGGSLGFAIALGRRSNVFMNLGATVGTRNWGIGALGGVHIKEAARMVQGTANQCRITDTAGSGGYPVQEIKFDQAPAAAPVGFGGAPIPVFSAVAPFTGVPVAASTTSGVSTTYAVADGLVTVTDAGAAFTAASVGRTLTCAGGAAGNIGTFPIVTFIDAFNVVIRNPVGVSEGPIAGTITENPVVTRWSQLDAAPYNGNAVNPQTLAAIVRASEA